MTTPYRVLARTYRPQRFDDLIGQEVLVRTLTNAFSSGRIAHAFLLTGIRGIGKTTTARIIARGLNCIGADGTGGPTTDPCGVCPNCTMILNDRHVDVIEMDAASRTGVDDIRELIDTVHYAPTSARYKIYIIDEVHMLSKNAFNALLKTLEEPPARVKFIFATTELRKIPITIVSRCQRFDLRRLDVGTLAEHLRTICAKESVEADAESLQLIATAAEGSVRDSLSLLDQAIALASDASGKAVIQADATRAMLGMTDKTQSFLIMDALLSGKPKEAVEALRELYVRGGDPIAIMQDLLGLTHYLTRIKLAAGLADNVQFSNVEQAQAKAMAASVDISVLARFWQMLLKGLHETRTAPYPIAAAEMILVRIAHSSTLPSPDELIRKLEKQGSAPSTSTVTAMPARAPVPAPVMQRGNLALAAPAAAPVAAVAAEPAVQLAPIPQQFEEMVALFGSRNEPMLYSHLYNDLQPVSFEAGLVVLHPVRHLQADVAARIGRKLQEWTGQSWRIQFGESVGNLTLREQAARQKEQAMAYIKAHPAVHHITALFPGAEIVDVTPYSGETS